ncbi:M23 family metallopeptidase [Glaesserella parasuis]|uniref:M23 family metallopeptidase n=1 Tax=Glaesserella parasuis TaxID=738 RepID=UPI0013236FF1|nr:M23 family metallopeptidase [Glaesserella parasuis]MDG6331381.1 M23 family metallopeptidase [Glaesserella parasuis]MDP0298844.1 M23 family metallopeptidase [Glaesserella parasuis]MWQ00064.1 M23 family metallopeptidase [Glaesserella parasuis]MWQ12750.1 M23 family metallopeptidase [Glaesserella parasuis]MWQ45623.1 M23 family metallopeptidase [Glaesserella parasuis]
MKTLVKYITVLGILFSFFIACIYLFKPPYFYAYARWLPTLLQGTPTEQSLPNPVPNQRFADTWHGMRSGGQNKLGGKVVSVMTGWTVHYYAHLEEYGDIKRHQWIEQGAVIGTVGDSGNAKGTPPHLHYGIYTPTGAVNPYPLIKQ